MNLHRQWAAKRLTFAAHCRRTGAKETARVMLRQAREHNQLAKLGDL